jgi:hypothetical protein
VLFQILFAQIMRVFTLLVLLSFTVVFGSCIEIIDDLTIKNDGSGSFKYTINLSSSKTKINSILALDSLDGKKVPKIADIKAGIERVKVALLKTEGLSNIKIDQDFTNFIFKAQVDFKSLAQLQNAIKKIISEESAIKNTPHFAHNWLNWENGLYSRSFPEIENIALEKLSEEDRTNLKKGTYSAITRFEKVVQTTNNPKAILSPNKLNVLLKLPIYECILNQKLQEITIQTTP